MTQSQPNPQPTGPSWRWPLIIIVMLSVHAIVMTAVVLIATRDKSFSVVPHAYESAQEWDKAQAQRRDAAQLGWKIEITPAPAVDPLGQRQAAFLLTDSHDKPIPAAAIDLTYFHRSHADDALRVSMLTDSTGRASRLLPMRYAGVWDFNFTITAAGQRFIASATQYVSNATQKTP